MRREPRDLARLFLDKAAQDEAAVRVLLPSRQVSDEIVAFHAQQACEKALKAVLALHGVRYGRTHNLGALLDLLADEGVDVPTGPERGRDPDALRCDVPLRELPQRHRALRP